MNQNNGSSLPYFVLAITVLCCLLWLGKAAKDEHSKATQPTPVKERRGTDEQGRRHVEAEIIIDHNTPECTEPLPTVIPCIQRMPKREVVK